MHYFDSSPLKEGAVATTTAIGRYIRRVIFSSPVRIEEQTQTPPDSPATAALSSRSIPVPAASPSSPTIQSSSSNAKVLATLPVIETTPIEETAQLMQNQLNVLHKLKNLYIECNDLELSQKYKEDIFNFIREYFHDFLMLPYHDRSTRKKDHLMLLELNNIIDEVDRKMLSLMDSQKSALLPPENNSNNESQKVVEPIQIVDSAQPIRNVLKL